MEDHDIVCAEAQLELCTGAPWVTREHGEDAGRTQLAEALGAALGDRRRYSSAFANGAGWSGRQRRSLVLQP